jgi:hypothetical protein
MERDASLIERSLVGTTVTGTAASLLLPSGSTLLGEAKATTTDPFTKGPDAEASIKSGIVTASGSPPTYEE